MKKIISLNFKRKNITLIILLSTYLITRLFFLFSINLYNFDECKFGTITHGLITGQGLLPFHYIQFLSPHYPGRLLTSFFLIPFYLIFGESGISLKLVFLIISAGIFCLVYLFLYKFFSKKSAVIAALLMIFSIPVYTFSTLSEGGPQLESLFFNILIMFLFYNIFFNKKHNLKSFMLFGLVCGFATFVNYSCLIMIFACILFWFIFDKKFFLKRHFFIFIIFFILGLSPLIYYNIRYNFVGLNYTSSEGPSFFSKIIGEESNFLKLNNAFIKLRKFGLFDLPKSFMFKDILIFNSEFLSCTYYFLFICSFAFLFYYCRKSIKRLILGLIPLERFNIKPEKIKKETFILIYPLVFILIYCISNFSVDHGMFGAYGYRYLLTFYVLMFIVFSLFLTKLWNKRTKIISILFIITLLLFGLIGSLSFVSFEDVGKGLVYRPFCYEQMGFLYECEQYNSLSEDYKKLCYEGCGVSVKFSDANLSDLFKEASNKNEKYLPYYYKGIGEFMISKEYKTRDIILESEKIKKEYKPYYYRGVGWAFGQESSHAYPHIQNFCSDFDSPYINYCFEGLGQGIGQYLGVIPTQAIRQCNKINEKYKPYCFKGLGWSIAKKFGDNPIEAHKFAKYIEGESKNYFYKGIGSYIGFVFSYNLTLAEKNCNKLKYGKAYCIQGLNEYLKDESY